MRNYDAMAHSLFKKLATQTVFDFEVQDRRIQFDLDDQGHSIQYFNVTSQYISDFIARFGSHSRHFHTSFVSIDAEVPPHTDIVDQVSINFYIETGGYQTRFYQGNDHAQGRTYADHGDGHVYDLDQLTELDAFVALPGDVYLLNGKCIHAVTGTGSQSRKFVQVSSSDLLYEQVLDMLNRPC